MLRADRHRAAALSIRDSPCKSSSVLSPASPSACLLETCNPEPATCLVHCLPEEGSAEHAYDRKTLAEPRLPARSHRRRWPSARTHLHRAANHAPAAHFPSAKLDRAAVRAEIADGLQLTSPASTAPPGRQWD